MMVYFNLAILLALAIQSGRQPNGGFGLMWPFIAALNAAAVAASLLLLQGVL